MPVNEQGSNMQERLDFLINSLLETDHCEVAETAIDSMLEILYGGLRPLPTQGEFLDQTWAAHEAVCNAEMQVSQALRKFVNSGDCPEQRGRALDLALFVEQMNEVAIAIAKVTAECGEGANLQEPPCDELQPILDEMTGHEFVTGENDGVIKRGYSVKLRGPRVAPWFRCIDEDMINTGPIPPDHCVVIFKEFRGLMVRLHFERIIIVTDPWVSTFGLPRGTRVPIWRLEWIFAEYVKQFNICNVGCRRPEIQTTVTQRVKQDYPLNYFWRYYRRHC